MKMLYPCLLDCHSQYASLWQSARNALFKPQSRAISLQDIPVPDLTTVSKRSGGRAVSRSRSSGGGAGLPYGLGCAGGTPTGTFGLRERTSPAASTSSRRGRFAFGWPMAGVVRVLIPV